MRRIRKTDTGPELTVRGLVHGMGYRYRLHRRDLPGTPDLVFPARRPGDSAHRAGSAMGIGGGQT